MPKFTQTQLYNMGIFYKFHYNQVKDIIETFSPGKVQYKDNNYQVYSGTEVIEKCLANSIKDYNIKKEDKKELGNAGKNAGKQELAKKPKGK
jgi:hypothetical protein